MIDRLLLSKFLFESGRDFLVRDEPYSYGLAVSLFQDAVECLLYSIAVHLDAKISPNVNFMDYWSLIEKAPKNDKKIEPPLKNQMHQLNRDRVDFKHLGNLPAPMTARSHCLNSEDFLRLSMEKFFEVKFNDVTRVDLLREGDIKVLIKDAENSYSQGEYKKCIERCSEAAKLALDSLKNKSFRRRFPSSVSFERTGDRTIDSNFNKVSKLLEIGIRHEREFAVVAALQLKFDDYERFMGIVPSIMRSYGGKVVSGPRSAYSPDEAIFCLKYVTDISLLIQNRI